MTWALAQRSRHDFGTPTELALKVASERKDFTDGKSIRVLARNDAPEFICQSCENTATLVCDSF